MEKLTSAQMIALVNRMLQPGFPEDEDAAALDALTRSTGNPHVSDLVFHPEPGKENMSAEEIVDEALSYRPIEL
ncbi:colicin immunity protein/pyocin immunity protein [Lentzea atacamensis]|uniref:Colicin immunity protein/pyocin immunity protein n=1 Tax=Lentzea atacamensis TaxID=531938 RepID=A0ABX9E915_9PSEU|nr:bacteriocin immunity protein [Lentzea atacamensis]RAS66200.1 colicin immunity protein/pyocin immunity protein [Lentzea atacamensis]